MGLELLGIVASFATIVSGLGWVLDRNSKRFQRIQDSGNAVMTRLTDKVDVLDKTLTQVRVSLPEKFVTKEELMMHIHGEETWHSSIDRRLDDIREELSALRQWNHR
jgi:hypothetical protein